MTGVSPHQTPRVIGLRANALAAVVMLLIQYSLGITVNLYSTLPASDHGKSRFASFPAAVGNGPVLLTLHAILGTLLLITALAALIRSLRLGAPPIALTALALLAILIAWMSGSEFIGHQKNGASLAMALATALAILCYTLVIFLLNRSMPDRR
jgi:quinol-cytochrome oxidoreductase complex cytochrome b subunit